MPEFILKSGAKLTVSVAAFEDGDALNDAVWEAKKSAVLLALPTDLLPEEYIHNAKVKECVFKCAASAIYDGAKVNRSLFDDTKLGVKARGDLYEIFAKVMEVNLNPFFVNASSELSTPAPAAS